MRDYIENGYRVIEHDDGTVERILDAPVSVPVFAVEEVPVAHALTVIDQAGRLDELLAWVETLPTIKKIQFQRIQTFRSDSPLLLEGAAALSLSQEEVVQLFAAAKAVEI